MLKNPGRGDWACLLTYGDHRRELSGGVPRTTNRMELTPLLVTYVGEPSPFLTAG